MKRLYFSMIFMMVVTFVTVTCDHNEAPKESNDFAVLAQQAEAYTQASPGRQLVFPQDHGPHPDYRIEWWYLTANLHDKDDRVYGIQWTLFRVATRANDEKNPSTNRLKDQLFMAHMAISTTDGHLSFQRYARSGESLQTTRSGVTASPFSAWLDDWTLQSTGSQWLPLQVRARQDEHSFDLHLQSDKPLVLQGDAGFSQKHAEGGGSHYYSQPFLKATGELHLDGQTIEVSGDAWLDREWGSQFLHPGQVGWDWFSIHLDSGEKLMLFQLRERADSKSGDRFLYGALISPDGTQTRLDTTQILLEASHVTRVQNRDLPLQWTIDLPHVNRHMTVTALHPDQWMNVDFPYWEGVISVTGQGPGNSGMGYMELTGYAVE